VLFPFPFYANVRVGCLSRSSRRMGRTSMFTIAKVGIAIAAVAALILGILVATPSRRYPVR
jgi:hypothetical protein